MFGERLLCKICVLFPIRHLGQQTIRRLCLGQIKTAPRKKLIVKEVTQAATTCFMELFECSYHKAHCILQKHPTLRDINRDRLEGALKMCNRFGMKKEDVLEEPDVLAILPVTIEHHSMLLEECGFIRVEAHCLVHYIKILKKNISLLKAYGYLLPDTNVLESCLSHVEPEVREIDIPRPTNDSNSSVQEANRLALRHYLAWRLETVPERIDAILKVHHRLKHKSLRIIRRTLDLLEFDIGFNKQKILSNGFLIHTHPENTELVLKRFKNIAGVPIRKLYISHPKIVATNYNTIVATLKHFKEFGITNEAVEKCPEIFTLASNTVNRRLSELKVVPEFNVLFNHPRVLRLVYYQKKAKSRLEYLQELRVKCVSLHILSGTEDHFEKYAKDGADKTKGTDISFFLGQELGQSVKKIGSLLKRHPFWCHIPLVSVRETLDYLLDAGFTKKQITKSIQIVLYSKDRVARELEKMPSHPELTEQNLIPLSKEWVYNPDKSVPEPLSSRPLSSFSNTSSSSSDDSSSDEDDVASPPGNVSLSTVPCPTDHLKQISTSIVKCPSSTSEPTERHTLKDALLELCIYYIEKEHHFTGNGIWTNSQSVEGFQSEVISHSPLTQVTGYKERLG